MIEVFVIAAITSFVILKYLSPSKTNPVTGAPNSYHSDYFKYQIAAAKDADILRQKMENSKMDALIEYEVIKGCNRKRNILIWEKETEGMEEWQKFVHPLSPGIEIFNPLPFCRYVYDSDSDKYKNIDIYKLIHGKIEAQTEEIRKTI